MQPDLSKSMKLVDIIETDYIKILFYELFPLQCVFKTYEYSRFCAILEGCKNITIDTNTSLNCNPGQFFFLPPYSNVHLDIDIRTSAIVLELNDKLLNLVTKKVSIDIFTDFDSLKENKIFVGDINNEIICCLNTLNNTLSISGIHEKNKKFLLDLCAQELAFHLIKIKGVQQILNLESDHPIHLSLKYIRENIENPISISMLATNFHMSESNFSNYFKKIIGVAPKVYITNLKLNQAKEMLKKQNVSEVAFNLGFDNLSYFISLFKSKFGVTPKQYQLIGKTPVIYK